MAGELSVSVDQHFARFGAKSYAINKINSVEVRRRYPNGRGRCSSSVSLGTFAFYWEWKEAKNR